MICITAGDPKAWQTGDGEPPARRRAFASGEAVPTAQRYSRGAADRAVEDEETTAEPSAHSFHREDREEVMRIAKIAIGFVGTLALLAGLHHIVVVNARGTAFSNAFAGTCSWCHGDTYDGFGEAAGLQPSFGSGFPRSLQTRFDALAACAGEGRFKPGRCVPFPVEQRARASADAGETQGDDGLTPRLGLRPHQANR